MGASEAGAAAGAAVQENKDQFVPWSRFSGVINENKQLKEAQDAQAGEIQSLKEQIAAGLQPAGGGRETQTPDIYTDPDSYVAQRVKSGVDEALAARDTEGREKQRKTNETEAMEYLQSLPEWKDDPTGADKDFAEVLREMRTNSKAFAEAAVLFYRDVMKEGGTSDEKEDKSGNRRASKQAVASLKGKSGGNGGFSRSQIKGMNDEEFLKNRNAIYKASEAGLISDD